MTGSSNYTVALEDLERSVRVPPDRQIEEQQSEPPREYLAPEDLDRLRLLADPASAGRLKPGAS